MPTKASYANGLWSLIAPEKITISKSGCWEWQGSLSPDGYAIGAYGESLHRAVCEAYSSHDIDGLVVHHKCKNRKCICPSHLVAISIRVHQKFHSADATKKLKAIGMGDDGSIEDPEKLKTYLDSEKRLRTIMVIRVSPELKERLQRQAIAEHTYESPSSMSDVVKRAVEDYLRTHTAN